LRNFSIGIILLLAVALAQAQSAATSPPPSTAPPLFKTHVDLVTVPVVIRDNKGHAVGTFKQEDFQLFDRGKPQEIVKFSVEKSVTVGAAAEPAKGVTVQASQPAPVIPDRFVAFLFDDLHIQFPDLILATEAASRNLADFRPTDRAAIYTTSGEGQLDFTDDQKKIKEALERLMPRPILDRSGMDCPSLSYYMADSITNKNDKTALDLAVEEVYSCAGNVGQKMATGMAQAAASRTLAMGGQESRVSLEVLKGVVRRMSGLPGKRTILMVSPGFLTLQQQPEKMDVLERAVRANVRINALDARGLYVDPALDASRRGGSINFTRLMADYDRDAALAQADVMAEMASGTGGTFFRNSNDFDEGFRRLASPPEYTYILGFSPEDLKTDGAFHSLKVKVAGASSMMEIDSRRGYYAPKSASDPVVAAKEEMQDALFTRQQMNEIPVQMRSELDETGGKKVMGVFIGIDPKGLRFRKEEGRNHDTLTVLSGLFDRNGNLVSSVKRTADLHLKDDTLEKLAAFGISVRTDFDVTPGNYLIRLVVRDSEGQAMSAISGTVVIP
jgi:VWFA-related protein